MPKKKKHSVLGWVRKCGSGFRHSSYDTQIDVIEVYPGKTKPKNVNIIMADWVRVELREL